MFHFDEVGEMTVIQFRPDIRPRVILDYGTVTRSDEFPIGSTMFWLEYQDDGFTDTIWIGATYEEARAVAREWTQDGVRLIDRAMN